MPPCSSSPSMGTKRCRGPSRAASTGGHAEFAPPTGVEPKVFAPFRASRPSDRTHSQLHQLKRKLLRAGLEETPETGSFKRICRAANQAAKLAWATSHPLLVFPHLFDEMVEAD